MPVKTNIYKPGERSERFGYFHTISGWGLNDGGQVVSCLLHTENVWRVRRRCLRLRPSVPPRRSKNEARGREFRIILHLLSHRWFPLIAVSKYSNNIVAIRMFIFWGTKMTVTRTRFPERMLLMADLSKERGTTLMICKREVTTRF